jgi:hypothetical protein
MMYVLRVKGKYFNTKYRPPDLLVIVNDMISYKIKLHLKSKNKNYSATIVRFAYRFIQKKKYINLKLKFR